MQPDVQIKSHSKKAYHPCPLENTRVHSYIDRLLKSDSHAWKLEGGQTRKYEHASVFEILFETENPGVG